MKVAEYQHCSMFGSYWIPCEVIGEEDGMLIVRYFDPVMEKPTEEEVSDARLIRWRNPEITKKCIADVATYAAMKFKTDLLIVDEEQLSEIARVVEEGLMLHFNYPD